jgi:hypothetical protein
METLAEWVGHGSGEFAGGASMREREIAAIAAQEEVVSTT